MEENDFPCKCWESSGTSRYERTCLHGPWIGFLSSFIHLSLLPRRRASMWSMPPWSRPSMRSWATTCRCLSSAPAHVFIYSGSITCLANLSARSLANTRVVSVHVADPESQAGEERKRNLRAWIHVIHEQRHCWQRGL